MPQAELWALLRHQIWTSYFVVSESWVIVCRGSISINFLQKQLQNESRCTITRWWLASCCFKLADIYITVPYYNVLQEESVYTETTTQDFLYLQMVWTSVLCLFYNSDAADSSCFWGKKIDVNTLHTVSVRNIFTSHCKYLGRIVLSLSLYLVSSQIFPFTPQLAL